jgi:hypothetical protein
VKDAHRLSCRRAYPRLCAARAEAAIKIGTPLPIGVTP